MAKRKRPLGAFGVVYPNGVKPGPPCPIPRVVVRDLGHVEPPPADADDPYGGPDWTPRKQKDGSA